MLKTLMAIVLSLVMGASLNAQHSITVFNSASQPVVVTIGDNPHWNTGPNGDFYLQWTDLEGHLMEHLMAEGDTVEVDGEPFTDHLKLASILRGTYDIIFFAPNGQPTYTVWNVIQWWVDDDGHVWTVDIYGHTQFNPGGRFEVVDNGDSGNFNKG